MKRIFWLLPVLAIAGAMVVNYFYATATSSRIQHLGSIDYPALASSQALSVDLDALEEAFKNAVSAGDKNGLQLAAGKAETFRHELQAYAALPGLQKPAVEFARDFGGYYGAAYTAASIMLGVQQGDVSIAAPEMQSRQQALAAKLKNNKEKLSAEFSVGLAASQAHVRSSLVGNMAAAVVILLVSLGVSKLSVGHVLKQLGGDPEYAKRVVRRVADGDLATAVDVKTGDQTSLLHATHDMQYKLAGMIKDVRASVISIATAADEITSGYIKLSERTSVQASNLEESTRSLDQLSEAVRRSADSAVEANALAGTAADVAGQGGKVVGDVVATMDAINASSRKVVDIIAVIDSIAFQTNILALNAAVEAARAGEQGRGFAVVATEVRNLAHRSAEAAREIKGLINDSVDKVGTGSQQVQAAGATMNQIVASVNQVRDIVTRIASASAEQSDGFAQVNRAIGALDGVAQQNAALVEEAAAATASMQQLAQQVAGSVSAFRLHDDATAISDVSTVN